MIISVKDFNEYWFRKIDVQKRRRGNQGNKKHDKYLDIITAFDIETTRLEDIEQSFMYIWQWQFGSEFTVIGRTWDEFKELAEIIKNNIKKEAKLVVFVHNLSYEFQFLRGIYEFMPEDVFAIDSRKVAKCTMYDCLEFRCSYIHSNMSLSEYTSKMGVQHMKLSGDDFDYSIKRYPWTKLSDQELQYCINDVLGLVEAISIEMKYDNDNLYTFPLTSTGYVRRDAKKAMKHVSYYYVRKQLPNFHIYQMCREAFRGGNTHANRFYAGKIVKNVKSADRSSSYPDVQCNCEFPVGEFFEAGPVDFDKLTRLIDLRHKAVLMRIGLFNVSLQNKYWGCPYLSKDKCRNVLDGVFDNGRILKAKYLETTITDIDFKIILSEYEFDDLTAFDVAYARYGKLPRPLIETIINYYKAKTELKGIEGEELFYMKSKNKLNSIYGMTAQDPVKQSIDFLGGEFIVRTDNPEELLEAANNRAFMPYQWGVWTTAWSRYRLEEGIRLAGEKFIYCDTDSVKYVGDIDWSNYNELRKNDSIKSGAYADDPKGNTHYMGVYEDDGFYPEFSTLGAKKYCYTDNTGKLHTTIAGVTKRKGGEELEKYGGIKAFKPGFVFKEAGGTESIYNDYPEMDHIIIDGKTIPITSNIVIKDSLYTLGITYEYERLLLKSRVL